MEAVLTQPPYFKIRLKDVVLILAFYVGFSYLYNVVLWYNMSSTPDYVDTFYNLSDYWYRSGMQYVFFFVASIIIWFFCIYLLRNQKKLLQIVLVTIVTPIGIYFLRELRYDVVDSMGLGRLRGTGEIWDWYIPLLFFYIQFGCYFAYQYFKEYQLKVQNEAALKQAALKSELSALKAQLNPHFLYNVFNTINASVPSEQEKTRDLIAQLSDLFRYQLRASKEDMVLLKDELEFIKKYLALEKERFGERLQINIDVPTKLLSRKIPPMLLQPIVENSIKHGLSSLIEGGELAIVVSEQNQRLHVSIADTGVGVADTNTLLDRGVGLTNTQLRLEKMYNSSLQIRKNEPKGLIVEFTI